VLVYPSGVPHAEAERGTVAAENAVGHLHREVAGAGAAVSGDARIAACEMLAGWMHEQSSDPDLQDMLLQVLLRH